MKVIFNTRSPEAAAAKFYIGGLRLLPNVEFFNWDNYARYDVALFMTYRDDLEDLVRAKKANPSLLVGLIDARSRHTLKYMPYVDFLVLDSLEMRDFFAGVNKPICHYLEYPLFPTTEKVHTENKRPVIIGYHGNQLHLASMFPRVTCALEALGKKYPIELWAVYDLRAGRCRIGLPESVPVRHIQWHERVYEEELAQVDIGIAPAMIPSARMWRLQRVPFVERCFKANSDDYCLRFKMPSNAGRVVVFSLLGIPVVADFLPSFLQLIRDGENGFLAYSSGAWYKALEALILSAELRERFATNLRQTVQERFDPHRQNEKLLDFCCELKKNKDAHPPLLLGPEGRQIRAFKRALIRKYLLDMAKKAVRFFRGRNADLHSF